VNIAQFAEEQEKFSGPFKFQEVYFASYKNLIAEQLRDKRIIPPTSCLFLQVPENSHFIRCKYASMLLGSMLYRLVLIISLALSAVSQQLPLPQTALERLFKQIPASPAWFDTNFLAQVPIERVGAIIQQYTQQNGAFQKATENPDGSYTVTLAHATVPARIVLNAEGRITGLWFGYPAPIQAIRLDTVITQFAKLPGKVSVLVTEENKPLASLHSDEALAVGSAFKLAILNAISDQACRGKHHWADVVPLNPAWRSLPSGVLRQWPDNTPLTLATLANEMISISDNTAADALLSIAERKNVEAFAPRNKPFLSTREAFTLKSTANAALLTRWRNADETGRRGLLEEIDAKPLPGEAELTASPIALDVEWQFTTSELCNLIAGVADNPAMHINPGLAQASDWKQVAYKGGSESGVLNMTTSLIGKNNKHYCAAATWNNMSPLDEKAFFSFYSELLSTLADRASK
jgi:beta-lactamase class A